MSLSIPSELEAFVRYQLESGRFQNEQQLVTKALELYQEMQTRHEELRGQVQRSLEQADRGEVADLDMEDIIARGYEQLADQNITD